MYMVYQWENHWLFQYGNGNKKIHVFLELAIIPFRK